MGVRPGEEEAKSTFSTRSDQHPWAVQDAAQQIPELQPRAEVRWGARARL